MCTTMAHKGWFVRPCLRPPPSAFLAARGFGDDEVAAHIDGAVAASAIS